MAQLRSFRWDLVYGVALAVILTVAVAVAWIQGEGVNHEEDTPANRTAHPAENCD